MRRWWTIGLALAAVAAVSGCVSQKRYNEALTNVDNLKSELERTQSQKNALEQQVKTLKDLNVKFGAESQAARDELQRIEHGRDKERETIEVRTKELEERIKQLTGQNRTLKQEYDGVKRHNDTLKSLVARYQKELKERPRSVTGTPAPSASITPSRSQPALTPPKVVPGGAPGAPKPGDATASLMNLNEASASDIVLYLGLSKDMAERIVNNRPYRVKGELVAKNVVPKETFDMIKDRVTVSP